jgi:hypothetical protein
MNNYLSILSKTSAKYIKEGHFFHTNMETVPDKIYKYITIKKRKNAKGKYLFYYYLVMRKYDPIKKQTVDLSATEIGLTSGSMCLGRAKQYDKQNPDYFFLKNLKAKAYKQLFLELFQRMQTKHNNIFKSVKPEEHQNYESKPFKATGYMVKRTKKYKKKDGSISTYTYYEDVKQVKQTNGKYKQKFQKYIGKF